MRKLAITFLVLGVFAASSAFASNAVRISQIYGGGGATSGTPTFNQDYVELFNSSGTDVDISGWAVQYSASASTAVWGGTGSTWQTYYVFPANTKIKACGYLLVGGSGAATNNTGAPLPITPDYAVSSPGNLAVAATIGRIGLFTSLFVGTICTTGEAAVLVDKVMYGNNNCAEGGAGAPVLTTILADFRGGAGMNDTDVNSADFATGTPLPRNSSTAINPLCTPVSATPTTWGKVKTIYR